MLRQPTGFESFRCHSFSPGGPAASTAAATNTTAFKLPRTDSARGEVRAQPSIGQQLSRRIVRLGHPLDHLTWILGELELHRRRADIADLPQRLEVLSERRVAASGGQITVVDAVAVGDVDLPDAAAEPRQLGGRNPLEPQVGDVDTGLHVL